MNPQAAAAVEELQRKIGLLENEIASMREINTYRLQQLLDIAADMAKEIAAASK